MAEVEFPDNDFTRMIEMTAEDNRRGVRGVASATPLPTVQSADLGKVVEQVPMTEAERAELDRLAVEAGIQDERLGSAGPEPAGSYTMEDAIAAGAPVAANLVPEYNARALNPARERMTAREYIGSRSVPRFPDFLRVEGINLIDGFALVDGMKFDVPPEKVLEFKRFVIDLVTADIMAKLTVAASLLTLPETAEGADGGGSTL